MALFDTNTQPLPTLPMQSGNLFSSVAPGQSPDAGGAGTMPAASPDTSGAGSTADLTEDLIRQQAQAEWDSNSPVHNFLDRIFNNTDAIKARHLAELNDKLVAYRLQKAKTEGAPLTPEETAVKAAQARHFNATAGLAEAQTANPEKYKQTNTQTPIEVAKVNAGASKYRSDMIKKLGDQRAKQVQMRPDAVVAELLDKVKNGLPITEDDVDSYHLALDYKTALARENPLGKVLSAGQPEAPETAAEKTLRGKIKPKGGGVAPAKAGAAIEATPPEVTAAFFKNPSLPWVKKGGKKYIMKSGKIAIGE